MTQVIGTRHTYTPSDRIGFKRKSIQGCFNDLKAVCAKAERMDLWQRINAVRMKKHLSAHAAIVLARMLRKDPARCEQYLAAIERNPLFDPFKQGVVLRSAARAKGTIRHNPKDGRRRGESAALALPDPFPSVDAEPADVAPDAA
jgi:hypothetical protein